MISLEADLHTHTVASGHAYSTIKENAEAANFKNLKILAMTDHAPAMPGSCDLLHFGNLRALPRYINNVMILRGVELNVLDTQGNIDLPEYFFSRNFLERMDWIIASLHENILTPEEGFDYTGLYMAIAENPYVDLLGHPDTPAVSFDIDEVVKAFKANNKIVELNEHHAFETSEQSRINAKAIMKACAKYGVYISVNSDAHTCWDVGRHKHAVQLLEEIKFPVELIFNADANRVIDYLINKHPALKAELR